MPQQTLDYRSPQPNQNRGRSLSPLKRFLARRWKGLAILVALGFFGLWVVFAPHPRVKHPASASDVTELTSVPPPPEATNIWVASCGEGGFAPGFQGLVRFEAPTPVCLQYAAAVLHGASQCPPGSFDPKLEADFFSDTSWFDLDKATDLVGFRSSSGTGRLSKVWVDRGRGVFYSLESD